VGGELSSFLRLPSTFFLDAVALDGVLGRL